MDPGRSKVKRKTPAAVCPDAAANAVAGLEYEHIKPGILQINRCGDAGNPCTNNDYPLASRTSGPP
jgi:hypothetical protein